MIGIDGVNFYTEAIGNETETVNGRAEVVSGGRLSPSQSSQPLMRTDPIPRMYTFQVPESLLGILDFQVPGKFTWHPATLANGNRNYQWARKSSFWRAAFFRPTLEPLRGPRPPPKVNLSMIGHAS